MHEITNIARNDKLNANFTNINEKLMNSREVTSLTNIDTIDLNSGDTFVKKLTEDTVITFDNLPGENTAKKITVIILNGNQYNVQWPDIIQWPNNEVPELTEGPDVLEFLIYNNSVIGE